MVHESLLTYWPRLVRWRIQDAEGAQLRDDLRHTFPAVGGAGATRLWTGSSRLELELWQQRYPGRLSRVEQAFVDAVARRARRHRNRRWLALGAALVALAVLAAVAIFWR